MQDDTASDQAPGSTTTTTTTPDQSHSDRATNDNENDHVDSDRDAFTGSNTTPDTPGESPSTDPDPDPDGDEATPRLDAVPDEYETLLTGVTAITALFTRPGAPASSVDRDAFLDAVRSAPAGHLTVLIAVFVGLTAGVVFAAWGVASVVTESVLTRPFVTIGVLVLFERFRISLAS